MEGKESCIRELGTDGPTRIRLTKSRFSRSPSYPRPSRLGFPGVAHFFLLSNFQWLTEKGDVSPAPTITTSPCSQNMTAPTTSLVSVTGSPPPPSPAPRRPTALSHHRKPWRQWPALLFVLFCLVCTTVASSSSPPSPSPSSPESPLPTETLELDLRAPYFEKGSWVILSREEHEMRMNPAKRSESAPRVTTTFEIAVSTVTEARTTSTVSASPLPSPLDSSLSSNFTGPKGDRPCPAFINSFLTNPTFKQCYPFSLLLQVIADRHFPVPIIGQTGKKLTRSPLGFPIVLRG